MQRFDWLGTNPTILCTGYYPNPSQPKLKLNWRQEGLFLAYRNVVVDESNGQGSQCRQHLEGQEEEQHVVDARELLVWARQGEI